jgi:hypothetical protein
MKVVPMKRVNIIGDETVQYRLVKEIHDLGASGYTYYLVHGTGTKGERPRHGEPGNMKIEVVCTTDLAEQILQHLADHYLSNYAMIAFVDDVAIVGGQQFEAQRHALKN